MDNFSGHVVTSHRHIIFLQEAKTIKVLRVCWFQCGDPQNFGEGLIFQYGEFKASDSMGATKQQQQMEVQSQAADAEAVDAEAVDAEVVDAEVVDAEAAGAEAVDVEAVDAGEEQR